MLAATPSAKISVAVNLRYSFDGDGAAEPARHPAPGRGAARGGWQLKVSVKQARGLQFAAGAADVCRKPAHQACIGSSFR